MTDLKPKPFHIGTRVRSIDGTLPNREYVVLFAFSGEVYVDFDGWCSEYQCNLVHADDGSPLGEWVPIDGDKLTEWALACEVAAGEPCCSTQDVAERVNAIIRGEIEQ